MIIPNQLSHFNLFIDLVGFAGTIKTIQLPKIAFKVTDYMTGGMDMPVSIEESMEKLTVEITMASYESAVFRLLGARFGIDKMLIARGALTGNDEKDVTPITVSMRGIVRELDPGSWGADNKQTELKFTMDLDYYRFDKGLENLIEIDVKNLVRKFGGVDQLLAIKKAIGFT